MRNTFLIMRQEIRKTLTTPVYVIFAFVIPVAAVLILAGVKFYQARSGGSGSASSGVPSQFVMQIEGYVDQSGLIHFTPADIPADRLLKFKDEREAQQALEAGEITAYYLIPSDIIEGGKIYYVYPNTRSYLDDGQPWVMARTVIFNLLEGNPQLTDRIWNPVWEVTTTSIAPQAEAATATGEDCSRPGASCKSNDLIRFMPSIMVGIFYLTFMVSSSMLFNSIGTEKENRVIEVVMLSVSPRQLLAGKTLGGGIAGLLQAAFWLGAIYFAFNQGGSTLILPENFGFPIDIVVWSLVFFIGGYGLYASLMAGAGALVPRMKEAGVANYIAAFPLFFGYAFGLMAPLAGAADSIYLVFLSLFPLTSPVVMIMRQTNGVVPAWQLLLSVLLLFTSAYYALHSAAAMFQAQNLLSGQPFSLRRYFRAMAGKQSYVD